MTDRLFAVSWHATWNNVIQRAVADVDRLDRQVFSNPALAGVLQEIVNKYSIEIARLSTDPKAITAVPVEDERYVDDYGLRRLVKVKRLRVTIPFTGEAESLKVAPSSSTVIFHDTEISGSSITITIADDANADREVKTFCDQVQGNLNTLQQEYERDRPQLKQAVFQAGERRKSQITAEDKQDSNRSFTVLR